MRGKAKIVVGEPLSVRITPAHAGKSSSIAASAFGCQDHPRPCGEKLRAPRPYRPRRGSPPPMRGKALDNSTNNSGSGITPAHAGKSGRPRSRAAELEDHPRPCGEKAASCGQGRAALGSPPPMRGKAQLQMVPAATPGITPAHAGKSLNKRRLCIKCKDHPRPCGEKLSFYTPLATPHGSPPPMRGKEVHLVMDDRRRGITPAHAGESQASLQKLHPQQDHPRPCGEKRACRGCGTIRGGSPPPMRGKAGAWCSPTVLAGITPAHAGKSYLATIQSP